MRIEMKATETFGPVNTAVAAAAAVACGLCSFKGWWEMIRVKKPNGTLQAV